MTTMRAPTAHFQVRILAPTAGSRVRDLLQTQQVTHIDLCQNMGQFTAASSPNVRARLLVVEHSDQFDVAGILEFIAIQNVPTATIVLGDDLSIHVVKALSKLVVWDTVSPKAPDAEVLDVISTSVKRLSRSAQNRMPVSAPKLGRCWSFVSTVGGAGATLMAVEAACQMARKSKTEKVCLFDLNFTDGSVSSYLNADANLSADALQQPPASVDTTFLNSIACQKRDRLDVIAAPRWTSSHVQPSETLILSMLEVACEHYDTVLIDVPRWPVSWSDKVFSGSDIVFLLSELTVPALNASRYWMQRMDALNGFDRNVIKPVLNRQSKGMFGARVSMQQAETALMRPVFGLVRSDWPSAMASVNLGKPVSDVKPNSAIVKDVAQLIESALQCERAVPRHAA